MRSLIDSLGQRFESIHSASLELLDEFPADHLFIHSELGGERGTSFAFELIRAAAEVEKAFGGITRRLWDDPFEWTLPEELSTKTAIRNYLAEVAAAREKGLRFIRSDEELSAKIPAPEEFLSLSEILTQTISRADNHLANATRITNARKAQ